MTSGRVLPRHRTPETLKPPHRTDYHVTVGIVAVGVTAFALLQSLVNPALPTIEHAVHTDQHTGAWLITAYLLSASVCTPIIGRVGDRIGKHRMLVIVLVALALGSLIAALASSIDVLLLARVVQGMGGGVIPLAFGIVRDEVPREKVSAAIGLTSALLSAGIGVGLVLSGPIVSHLDYHWLFWFPLIVAAGAAVAAAVWIPSSPVRSPGPISVWSALLLSAWLVCLLLGVSEGQSWGWTSGRVIVLIVSAVLACALWVRTEARSVSPLVDMVMMRLPGVWTTNAVSFLFGLGMFSLYAFLPQFLETPAATGYGLGESATRAGLLLVPMSTATFLAGIASARLTARLSARWVLVGSSALDALALAGLTVAHEHGWQIVVTTTVLGVALGLAFAAMSNLVVEAVSPAQTGVASGMNANIRNVGGAIGGAIVAALVTSRLSAAGLPLESGYRHAFAALACVAVLATVLALLVPRPSR